MTPEEQEQSIYQTISQVVQSKGLDLIEVKIARHKSDVFIQVLADKPQGGINLEACSELNRSIVEVVDKEGILSEDGYSLEVASPGLDRPLVTYKDFLRNIGLEVRIFLKEKIAGKFEHVGVVKHVTEDALTFFITKDKKEIVLPLNIIDHGLLVI